MNCNLEHSQYQVSKQDVAIWFDEINDKAKNIGFRSGQVKVSAPSNIALVKYWGKTGQQLPLNSSLSLTLNHSTTETQLVIELDSKRNEAEFCLFFEGIERPDFMQKLLPFWQEIKRLFPWLTSAKISIHTSNTFPHSAGIASSASSSATLALGLIEIFKGLGLLDHAAEKELVLASYLARLGSGSACRSLFPVASLWGHNPGLPGNDYFAVPLPDCASFLSTLCDAILIVDQEEKKVSSRAGHALMQDHPHRESRIAQAQSRTHAVLAAIEQEDFWKMGEIIEAEALELHALMMSGSSPFILIRPNTLAIIEGIWKKRKDNGLPVFFTLDAGPNVHLLYRDSDKIEVETWVRDDLSCLCQKILWDKVGPGPVVLEAYRSL